MNHYRPEKLISNNIDLQLPVFFPSISSLKTISSPETYIKILIKLRKFTDQFLVSAYDMYNSDDEEWLINNLKKSIDNRQCILLDSGNYESYWKSDSEGWNEKKYYEILNKIPNTFAFSFDNQKLLCNDKDNSGLIIKNWEKDTSKCCNQIIVPIVHGKSQLLPEICYKVAISTNCIMIAVPERVRFWYFPKS
jgi:hypothetical protein